MLYILVGALFQENYTSSLAEFILIRTPVVRLYSHTYSTAAYGCPYINQERGNLLSD